MLNDLKEYEYLGSPNFFYLLFKQMVEVKNDWTIKDIRHMFANKIIDGRMDFNGCLSYAISLGFLIPTVNDSFSLNPVFKDFLVNKTYLQDKVLEETFVILKDTKEFFEIFDPSHILYDVTNNAIEIKNSAFRFEYSNFKQLLIDFEFISPLDKINRYIVNARYKRLFDTYILPSMKDKRFGIDELLKLLEKKKIYGEEAEAFVVEFEKKRLSGHKSIRKILKISDYDVSAGYDVVSFDNVSSEELDRFIEVKSFAKKESFYWSRNEIEVAKIKRNEYFLYLVDRSKISIDGYSPTIIQDPYENVLRNEKWNKTVEKFFITN